MARRNHRGRDSFPASPARQAAFARRARFERLEDRCLLSVGAELVKDINAQPDPAGSNPTKIVDVGGIAYFVAYSRTAGEGLWRTDGTAAGTVLLKVLHTVENLTDVNGTLYFSASDGVYGRELWKSDGTTAGTVLVKEIPAATAAHFPVC